ncbi:MAG: triose-phosphate isomerase [Proteobacteria bacterium]|nr:triose-phosphate isomerase [Pseudomonadota bacterium]
MQTSRRRPWIGTSWKMNHLRASAVAFAETLRDSKLAQAADVQPFVIPPFPYIADVAAILKDTKVVVGAQNMHWADQGAWTGEISPLMIKECGASLVELGHSERRANFGETDDIVSLKVEAALRHNLTPLVCIGDTHEEFAAGKTADALERQVRALLSRATQVQARRIIIAYEPVWSIGEKGTPAKPDFVNAQHRRIRQLLQTLLGHALPILYGGSVNPGNAVELASASHVDGLFIGRSAWDAKGYIAIMESVVTALGDKT